MADTAPPAAAGIGGAGKSVFNVQSPLAVARASASVSATAFSAASFAGHAAGGAGGAAAGVATCSLPVGVISVAPRTPLAWSGDGTALAAAGGNGGIFILAFAGDTYKLSKLLLGHKHTPRALLFHPHDANMLVSSGADGVFVWDVAAGVVSQVATTRPLKEFALTAARLIPGGHDSEVECMTWVHDGAALVTGSKDNNLKVWDTAGGRGAGWRLMETITGHKAPVLGVAFSPASGRLASAGRDASIKVWDASSLALDWRARRADDSGITCGLVATCEGHGDIVSVVWAPDGNTLISGSRDNSLRMWHAATGVEVREVYDKKLGPNGKHRSDATSVTFVPGGSTHLLTTSLDGTLRLWRLAAVDALVAASAGSGAGAGGGESKEGKEEDDAAGAAGTGLGGGGGGGGAAGGAGAGAAGGGAGGDADLLGAGWDETTKALLADILGESTVAVVAAAAAGIDRCLASLRTFGPEEGIATLAINPVRPVVAVSSNTNAFSLLALRLDTFPWLERMYDGPLPPGAVAPGTNLDPLVPVQSFYGHTAPVTAVSLMPDDRALFTGSADGTAARYDVATLERLASYPAGTSVHAVALGGPPAGGAAPMLYTGAADYIIRAYSTAPSDYDAIRRAYAAMPVPTPVPSYEYEVARYVGHSGCLLAIAIDPQNRYMASGGRDWSVLLWDLRRPTPVLSVR